MIWRSCDLYSFSSVHNHHTWTVICYLFLHHHDNQTPLSQQIIGGMAGRKLLPTAQGPSRQAWSVSNDGSISTPGSGSLSAPFVASVDDDSWVMTPVAISCLEIQYSVRVTSKARSVQPTVRVPPIVEWDAISTQSQCELNTHKRVMCILVMHVWKITNVCTHMCTNIQSINSVDRPH